MSHPLPSVQFAMAQLLPDIFEPHDPASLARWLTNDAWPRIPFKPLKLDQKKKISFIWPSFQVEKRQTQNVWLETYFLSCSWIREKAALQLKRIKTKGRRIFFGFLDQSILIPHSWGPDEILPWYLTDNQLSDNQLLSLLFALFSLSWFLLQRKACWLVHCISNDW